MQLVQVKKIFSYKTPYEPFGFTIVVVVIVLPEGLFAGVLTVFRHMRVSGFPK